MAYKVTFWKVEGKSDIELANIRLKAIIEAMNMVDSFLYSRNRLAQKRDLNLFDYKECKVITLDRTDGQSPISKILWQDKDYKDLNER